MERLDEQPHRQRWDRAVAFLPAALTAWVALPFVRPDRWVTGFDTIAYSGPNLVVSLEEIRHGRIPQWNSDIFGGVTHIGNAQAAVFEPLMWLASPLPFHRALLTVIAAHLVILAAGMWWLLRRRLYVAPAAAALGTLGVIGSGLVMSRSIQFEQIAVVAWVPWMLVGCDLTLDPQGSRRRLAVLPLAAAALVISGHPQQVYISIPLGLLWCAGRFLDHRPGWPGLARLAGAGVLAVGLASAQLLPNVLALDDSAIIGQRDISDASSPLNSSQARRLPSTVLGDIAQETHPFTAGSFEATAFIGAVVTALALLGLLTMVRRRERWTATALAIAVALGALLSLGPRTAVYRVMYRIIPGFDLARVPGRWMLLVVIGASVLAAIGLDQMVTDRLPRRRVIVAAGALTLVVVTTWFGPLRRPSSAGLLWWGLAFSIVVVAVLATRSAPRLRTPVAVLVAVLATIELGVMSNHSLARDLQERHPLTELGNDMTDFLRDRPGRAVSLTDERLGEPAYLVPGLRPNANAAIGISSLDGYDGGTQVTKRWVQAVTALAAGPVDPELTLRSQLALPVRHTLAAHLGVRWLVIDTKGRLVDEIAPGWGAPVRRHGSLVLLENPAWQGDAVLVHRSSPAPKDQPARALQTAANDTVVLERQTPQLRCGTDCDPTAVDAHRLHPGAIDIDLPVGATAGMLVVDEQMSPGWSAKVDGRDEPIAEANGMFIGVAVPDGARRVELRFAAPGLATGLKASGVSALGLLSLLVPVRRGRTGGTRQAQPDR